MRKIILNNKLDFIDIVVLSFYYLFVCFLFLGLFGFFNRFLVFLILFVLALGLFSLRRHISFNKKYLWFFILVPLITTGFGLLRGFFSGSAYQLLLPVARDTVQIGHIPEFLAGWCYIGMPLLSLLFAGTFAFFNSFNEYLCLWVPFFFTGATLVVLYQWAKDKNLSKKFLFFIPFLFLANSLVEFYGGWNLLQESLVLFFSTTFFYYYEKYLAVHQKRYLIFFILSFVLACASKISGFFLFLIILFFFFRTKEKKNFISYLFVFSLPIIFWLIRNYIVFENPFFPAFNNIFKGKYYDVVNNYFAFSVLPGHLVTIWDKFAMALRYVWFTFPFILLSLYGFIKHRRYEYLFLVVFYFLVKEIFLFTPTISSVRYYYLFLGLLLVYAFLGLMRLKSPIAITVFVVLAVVGLLLVPVTDSSSQFISLFENKLSLVGNLANFLHNYWYLIIIVLLPFIYQASKKKDVKIFLILFYCLYILHLSFIANKSWLNTWPFILLALVFLLVFVFRDRIKYLKQIVVIFIILTVFINSWAMAAVYYWNQGNISLPVPFIWENSRWAHYVLDEQIKPDERDDFYILVAVQKGYYGWRADYQAITIFDFDFWMILIEYHSNLSDLELHQLLVQKHVKYIVKNSVSSEIIGKDEFNPFFEKVKNSEYFQLIASKDDKYFIWQVY